MTPSTQGTSSDAGARIVHPGPPHAVRLDVRASSVRSSRFRLAAGSPLLGAVWEPLAAAGVRGAVATLSGGSFEQLTYLNPARCTDGTRAVTFSEPIVARAPVTIESGNLTLGYANGEPFAHCHVVFVDSEGTRRGGHVVPHLAVVGEPIDVGVDVFEDVALEVLPDEETGFSLFQPQPLALEPEASAATTASPAHGLFARVRPHEDLVGAVETLSAGAGFPRAQVRGIGSLIGANYVAEPGRAPYVPGPAVEVLDLRGEVVVTDGRAATELDITCIDVQRRLSDGRLVRGHNPVAVTYELALLPVER